MKMISQKECKSILKQLMNDHFNIPFPVELQFVKNGMQEKTFQKYGLQRLVPDYCPWSDNNRGFIEAHMPIRKNSFNFFEWVIHDLHHIQDIVDGFLEFKGNSIIWCDREYKLGHKVVPGNKKGYYHYGEKVDYGIIPPWEAFHKRALRLAMKEHRAWLAK